MIAQVNPEMLILGRELRGLTQTELARESSIEQALISRYENQSREITPRDLLKIASVLSLPEDFFSRIGQRYGLGSNVIYHRKQQSVPARTLKMLYARINLFRLNIQQLLASVEIETPFQFHEYRVTNRVTPEHIAAYMRGVWQLPTGPINNLVMVIENAGGIVVPTDFSGAKIDALVQWIPPTPPIVLVNNSAPGDRLRYTLAHEIGHLVMHPEPNDLMEEEADRFAAAFLMPANEIRSELEPVSLAHLAQLKLYWRVSIQALIFRARDLGKITERQYRSLFEQMSKLGYRTSEPNPIPREQPTLLKELIDIHLNDFGYSVSELAKLLTLPEDEFRQAYLLEHSSFRIVKGTKSARSGGRAQ